jgi:hypothetical protein
VNKVTPPARPTLKAGVKADQRQAVVEDAVLDAALRVDDVAFEAQPERMARFARQQIVEAADHMGLAVDLRQAETAVDLSRAAEVLVGAGQQRTLGRPARRRVAHEAGRHAPALSPGVARGDAQLVEGVRVVRGEERAGGKLRHGRRGAGQGCGEDDPGLHLVPQVLERFSNSCA